MIQLQSRVNPYIGETPKPAHEWRVDDEATIVTKSMRAELKRSTDHGGERAYRIVDTRKNPELKVKELGPAWQYRPATR